MIWSEVSLEVQLEEFQMEEITTYDRYTNYELLSHEIFSNSRLFSDFPVAITFYSVQTNLP